MGKQPATWYKTFRSWINEPSPTGLWLYRGQSVQYESIVPSLCRDGYKHLYRNTFYDVSYQLAQRIFETSPVFVHTPLYHHLIHNDTAKLIENIAYKFVGGPPTILPQLSYPEIIRALAQHYGFPTMFVDLTFDPNVAAFFATHTSIKGQYFPKEKEEGIVYRWPAVQTSDGRLKILLGSDQTREEIDAVNAINLTNISPYLRRPFYQSAVLATPVYDPWHLFRVFPYMGEIEDFEITDLAKLSCCERMEIPRGVGNELSILAGVSASALFPDLSDLGYSYIVVIALLSMLLQGTIESSLVVEKTRTDFLLAKRFEQGILASQIILDRECLRLVPNCPITNIIHQHPLRDAEMILEDLAQITIGLVQNLKNPLFRLLTNWLNRAQNQKARTEIKIRVDAYRQAIKEVTGDDPGLELVKRRKSDQPVGWVIPEIQRRQTLVKEVMNYSEKIPPFAIVDPAIYERYSAALPSDLDYETKVKEQVASLARLRSNIMLFPPFRDNL